MNRNITELAPGATSAAIQRAIDNAVARWNGRRPVIHLPAGSYAITSTTTIPANSEVQLVGDGFRTHLYWRGAATEPVIWIKGPSHATLREIHIDGNNGTADSIVADNIDQVDSRVFTHRTTLGLSAASQNAILVEGLDHTFVELQDTQRAGHGANGEADRRSAGRRGQSPDRQGGVALRQWIRRSHAHHRIQWRFARLARLLVRGFGAGAISQ
jgi:hypothetical protein